MQRLSKRKFHLLVDRTNWSFGQVHFNFLVIAVAFKEIAIPIYWVNLAKAGTSKVDHRIFAVIRSCVALGKKNIKYLIADREFVGREWLSWLYENDIDCIIRIKGNMQLKRRDESVTNARSSFSTLARCKKRRLKEPLYLEHIPLFLSASRNPAGEFLIVACPKYEPKALALYKRRFQPNLGEAKRIRIEVDDLDGAWSVIADHLDEVFAAIDSARVEGKNVLIHCVKGASRSAAVVCAYMMKRFGVSLDKAFNYVQTIRHQVELKTDMRSDINTWASEQGLAQ